MKTLKETAVGDMVLVYHRGRLEYTDTIVKKTRWSLYLSGERRFSIENGIEAGNIPTWHIAPYDRDVILAAKAEREEKNRGKN